MIPITKLVTFGGRDPASNVSSISKIGIQIEPLIQAFKTWKKRLRKLDDDDKENRHQQRRGQ